MNIIQYNTIVPADDEGKLPPTSESTRHCTPIQAGWSTCYYISTLTLCGLLFFLADDRTKHNSFILHSSSAHTQHYSRVTSIHTSIAYFLDLAYYLVGSATTAHVDGAEGADPTTFILLDSSSRSKRRRERAGHGGGRGRINLGDHGHGQGELSNVFSKGFLSPQVRFDTTEQVSIRRRRR
jgi:hypothetical protein